LPRREFFHLLVDVRDERAFREHKRFVKHHQRAECRNGFHDSGNALGIQRLRERKDRRAEFTINAVAELDDERRVSR
jgi:hypothetical protein